MGLNKFNQRSIGVFDIAELAAGFTHVKAIAAIHGKGVSRCCQLHL